MTGRHAVEGNPNALTVSDVYDLTIDQHMSRRWYSRYLHHKQAQCCLLERDPIPAADLIARAVTR